MRIKISGGTLQNYGIMEMKTEKLKAGPFSMPFKKNLK